MDWISHRYVCTIAILWLTLFRTSVQPETIQNNQTSTDNHGFNHTVAGFNHTVAGFNHTVAGIIVGSNESSGASGDGNTLVSTSNGERTVMIFEATVDTSGKVATYHPIDIGPQNYTLLTQIDICGAYCIGTDFVLKLPYCRGITCRNCYCDRECTKYGDCCPNADGAVPEIDIDVEFSCVELTHPPVAFYMVRSCPDNINSSDLGVEKSDQVSPVTSLLTNNTYTNSFYALCNKDTEFVPWASLSVCEENTEEGGEDLCFSIFFPSPTDFAHRECSTNSVDTAVDVVDRCNASGQAAPFDPVLEGLCRSSEYHIQSKDGVYRNPLCYLCNLQPNATVCTVQYVTPPHDNVVISDLTDMFNRPDEIIPSIPVTCPEKQWKDPVSGECMLLFCMVGRLLEGNDCIVEEVALLDVQYTFAGQFSMAREHGRYNWEEIVDITRLNIPQIISQFDPLVYMFDVTLLSRTMVYADTPRNETGDDLEIGLDITYRSKSTMSRYMYEEGLFNRLWDEWRFRYKGVEIPVQIEPYNHNMYRTDSETFVYDPVNNTCCSADDYYTWKSILSTTVDRFLYIPTLHVSLSATFPCPYLSFTKFEAFDNGSMLLLQNNVTLQKRDYLFQYGSIIVCASKLASIINNTIDPQLLYPDDMTKYNPESYERTILVYITYTCVCLSLVSILLAFITFFMFPTLRTLPSKNTMSLALSIFAAQAIFLVSGYLNDNRLLCKIIAVLIHFLWLSVIFWMNVCCYHMFRVFALSSRAKMTSPNHWKTLLKYSLYVYGMSSLVVGASVGANYLKSGGVTIGYADRKACYISEPLVIALAFVLPLGITIVANTILFSLAVYTISRISKVKKASSTDRGHLMVYIKLSTLTGGFWLLAILAEVTNIFALAIASQILNGGQGVFILLSYATNRRVYRLWATACCKKGLKYRSSMSTPNTESSKF